MQDIKILPETEKRYDEHFNSDRYFEICANHNFKEVKKAGIACGGDTIDFFYNLCDHMYLFKDANDKLFFIANTYVTELEIKATLKKYGLEEVATILGSGFWCYPKTTAIMYPQEQFLQKVDQICKFTF